MKDNLKISKLSALFSEKDKILIAFSGGVDSTFLLYALKTFSKASIAAVTIKTPYIPQWEVDEAIIFCKSFKISHEIIELPIHHSLINNPDDRCYICKLQLFKKIKEFAINHGYNIIADGTNADDTDDYRPGMKALKELKIRSPLLECGFTKADIRAFLKESELEIWNKPAYACLLTRIPHNTLISEDSLHLIEKAELFLHKEGFPGTRLRLHGNLVRIETDPDNFNRIIDSGIRERIIQKFKTIGIKYITLDIEGYRTGSMNTQNKDIL